VDQWHKHQIAKPIGVDVGGDAFLLEKSATTLNIPGMCVTYRENIADKFEWDVVRVPAHPKGPFTGMGTYGYAVSANAQRPQAAWDFVKYLASPTGQSIIARTYAGIPLLKSMADDPTWRELPPPPANKDAFILSAEIGIRQYVYPRRLREHICRVSSADHLHRAGEGHPGRRNRSRIVHTEADAEIQACLDQAFSA
jgi:multiple sugar transport system substrate-binding protein